MKKSKIKAIAASAMAFCMLATSQLSASAWWQTNKYDQYYYGPESAPTKYILKNNTWGFTNAGIPDGAGHANAWYSDYNNYGWNWNNITGSSYSVKSYQEARYNCPNKQNNPFVGHTQTHIDFKTNALSGVCNTTYDIWLKVKNDDGSYTNTDELMLFLDFTKGYAPPGYNSSNKKGIKQIWIDGHEFYVYQTKMNGWTLTSVAPAVIYDSFYDSDGTTTINHLLEYDKKFTFDFDVKEVFRQLADIIPAQSEDGRTKYLTQVEFGNEVMTGSGNTSIWSFWVWEP